MSYVIDASSLLNLTRELGEDTVDVLKDNLTSSLAIYEIGNGLWKECNLLEDFSFKDAAEILEFTTSIMETMKVIHLGESDLEGEVLHTAKERNITYYDATYLTIAENSREALVTDDGKLRDAAKKAGVKAMSSDELSKG